MHRGWFLSYLRVSFLLLLLLLSGACTREEKERAIGEGFVGSSRPVLRDRLGPGSSATGALNPGDRVEILQRRRRWVRIRSGNQEGWLEERHIVPRETYEQFEQLLKSTTGRPSQGGARARSAGNLHLEPSRSSPALHQLQEGESCDVLEHRAVEKPLPPGTAPPKPPAATEASTLSPAPTPAAKAGAKKAKGKKGKAARETRPPGPPMEDWYLVRANGKAGWVLARMVEMAVPDEVAQYAEGKAITAWQLLNEVQSGSEKKGQYVWGTSDSVGSPYDFTAIRVFVWNPARKRYETSYHESNIRGLSLTAERVKLKEAEVPAFTVTALDRAGNRVSRQFVLLGTKVRRREQVE